MKSFGANIVCHQCNAQPHPDPGSGFRESFDLVKVGNDWFCEQHRPSLKEKRSRTAAATPTEAADQFEQTLATEFSGLQEAVVDGDRGDITDALKDYGEALGRALTDFKKAVVEQAPPRTEKIAQSRRPRPKQITARERDQEGQGSLIEDQKTEG